MMRFMVHIINYVEPLGTVKIQDLNNSLKLSIKACFPYGKWANKIRICVALGDPVDHCSCY